jgi:hypothetical protein
LAITLPPYYANNEDYVTATGLMEEIKWTSTLTRWNKEQKSNQLIGTLRGLAAEFTEDLLHYQINWKNWRKVSTTFIQKFDKIQNPHLEQNGTSPTRDSPSEVKLNARYCSSQLTKEALTNRPAQTESLSKDF